MHLAIKAAQGAVSVDHRRRIVINARGSFLEERSNQDDTVFSCGGGQLFAAWAGDGLGQIEQRMVFTLAEVLRLEKLRQANDIRATLSGVSNALQSFFEIFLRLRSAGHLDQTDPELFRRQRFRPPRSI